MSQILKLFVFSLVVPFVLSYSLSTKAQNQHIGPSAKILEYLGRDSCSQLDPNFLQKSIDQTPFSEKLPYYYCLALTVGLDPLKSCDQSDLAGLWGVRYLCHDLKNYLLNEDCTFSDNNFACEILEHLEKNNDCSGLSNEEWFITNDGTFAIPNEFQKSKKMFCFDLLQSGAFAELKKLKNHSDNVKWKNKSIRSFFKQVLNYTQAHINPNPKYLDQDWYHSRMNLDFDSDTCQLGMAQYVVDNGFNEKGSAAAQMKSVVMDNHHMFDLRQKITFSNLPRGLAGFPLLIGNNRGGEYLFESEEMKDLFKNKLQYLNNLYMNEYQNTQMGKCYSVEELRDLLEENNLQGELGHLINQYSKTSAKGRLSGKISTTYHYNKRGRCFKIDYDGKSFEVNPTKQHNCSSVKASIGGTNSIEERVSVISKEDLKSTYDKIFSLNIPYKSADEFCYARSFYMGRCFKGFGINLGQLFAIAPHGEQLKFSNISWDFHVAPYILVKENKKLVTYIFDPSIEKRPLKESEWVDKLISHNPHMGIKKFYGSRFQNGLINTHRILKNYRKEDITENKESMKKNWDNWRKLSGLTLDDWQEDEIKEQIKPTEVVVKSMAPKELVMNEQGLPLIRSFKKQVPSSRKQLYSVQKVGDKSTWKMNFNGKSVQFMIPKEGIVPFSVQQKLNNQTMHEGYRDEQSNLHQNQKSQQNSMHKKQLLQQKNLYEQQLKQIKANHKWRLQSQKAMITDQNSANILRAIKEQQEQQEIEIKQFRERYLVQKKQLEQQQQKNIKQLDKRIKNQKSFLLSRQNSQQFD